ncbi:hypothetical protein SUGI_0808840 [Cryptomeria japonica]|nr:hypothetical protein SUGI_0808840 [Cryptomeria japonica]
MWKPISFAIQIRELTIWVVTKSSENFTLLYFELTIAGLLENAIIIPIAIREEMLSNLLEVMKGSRESSLREANESQVSA